jgi:hypothetical protein
LETLENIFDRLASAASFFRLMVDHLLCPDMIEKLENEPRKITKSVDIIKPGRNLQADHFTLFTEIILILSTEFIKLIAE